MIRLVPRLHPPWWMQAFGSAAAVALTLLFGAILFAALGQPPLEVLGVFLTRPLSSLIDIGDLLQKSGPLILIALGLSVGYRANVWNIGAEGQFILGAVGAMGFALAVGNPDTGALLVPMLVAGTLAGMMWAAVPALLRTAFNASELLTSLMLVYVAQQLLYFVVHQAWKSPFAFGWPETVALSEGLTLPVLVSGTHIHAGLIIVLAAVVVVAVLMRQTTFGLRIQLAQSAPGAMRFAGFHHNQTVWLSLLLGGAMAGLAGAIELASTFGKLDDKVGLGYGFTAIIVAFLGRLHPVGIVAAGLAVGYTFVGGDWIKVSHGVNDAAADVFQASLLFFVLASDLLTRYRIERVVRRPAREHPAE